MYGVVLMMAMTGGAETPALFGRNKGCSGCSGSVSYACGGYSSCYGSYSSCYGGCSGGRTKHHKRSKSCGGCTGYATYSCGGCTGYSSCYGGYAPVGCTGYVPSGCSGFSSYPAAPAVGCYGSPVVVNPSVATPPVVVNPHPQVVNPPVEGKGIEAPKDGGKTPEKIKKNPKPDSGEAEEAATALITVSVPAGAKLLIDGAVTASTEGTRVFESPVLVPGKSYVYTLEAEFVRDGKTVVVKREIKVAAGAEVNVSMEKEVVVAAAN